MTTGRAHLFLATNRAAFGEALVGLELARELHAAGDRVAFLHPAPLTKLFHDVPFPRGTIDVAAFDLPRAIRDTVKERGFDTVVLVDVVSVLGTAGPGVARAMIQSVPARVLGIDLWNLPDTDLTWDVGVYQSKIDPISLEIPSLRPCPMARPQSPGGYRALPVMPVPSPEERTRIRSEAGATDDERLVMVTTGAWQLPNSYYHQIPRQLAERFPDIFALVHRRLGRNVRMIHVGPQPFEWARADPSYRWRAQVSPAEFRVLLASADLLLSVNVPATSLAAAIAAGVPSVVIVNDVSGDTIDDVERNAGHGLPDDLRAWITTVLPLRPFRVCPVGLHAFLAPVLADNPFRSAFREVRLTDLDDVSVGITELLEDDGARARMSADQARYREVIAQLPSALERFRQL